MAVNILVCQPASQPRNRIALRNASFIVAAAANPPPPLRRRLRRRRCDVSVESPDTNFEWTRRNDASLYEIRVYAAASRCVRFSRGVNHEGRPRVCTYQLRGKLFFLSFSRSLSLSRSLSPFLFLSAHPPSRLFPTGLCPRSRWEQLLAGPSLVARAGISCLTRRIINP